MTITEFIAKNAPILICKKKKMLFIAICRLSECHIGPPGPEIDSCSLVVTRLLVLSMLCATDVKTTSSRTKISPVGRCSFESATGHILALIIIMVVLAVELAINKKLA